MRVATLFGTRPEIIRLSRIIERVDALCENRIAHTGQNYDPNLSDIFFNELGLRQPDEYWGIKSESAVDQIGSIIARSGRFFEEYRPDRVLILGDTNSGLAAIAAARMGIPVFHMEAGNRCFDDRVPEEVNRRLIDQCSAVLLPYTHRSKENLLQEGFDRNRIYVTGNPIFEVMSAHKQKIEVSTVLERMDLERGKFFVATMHRAENVDVPERLESLILGMEIISSEFAVPVVLSVHPRTANRISKLGTQADPKKIRFHEPFGFFDFVKLETESACILTDSGTVQEEAAILNKPNVIIRDVTERAETLESGSGVISGVAPDCMLLATKAAMSSDLRWHAPDGYLQPNVSSVVANLLMGFSFDSRHNCKA